ncbi:hypothetical protein ACO0LV_15010 [Pseudactinotalea sp. Z1739]|uniref:hypothetical protein n=1 Tax=Pseudactinotalea sp. Z1739 TaxID=3413028 RepID=UPI003C7E6D44
MKVPLRLGLYGAGLVVVFVAAAAIGDVAVPEETVQDWVRTVEEIRHEEPGHPGTEPGDDESTEADPAEEPADH